MPSCRPTSTASERGRLHRSTGKVTLTSSRISRLVRRGYRGAQNRIAGIIAPARRRHISKCRGRASADVAGSTDSDASAAPE